MARDFGAASAETTSTNLVLTFRSAGVNEVREASRIAIDGRGRLILYRGTRPGECLVLSRIRELRISPVHQQRRARLGKDDLADLPN